MLSPLPHFLFLFLLSIFSPTWSKLSRILKKMWGNNLVFQSLQKLDVKRVWSHTSKRQTKQDIKKKKNVITNDKILINLQPLHLLFVLLSHVLWHIHFLFHRTTKIPGDSVLSTLLFFTSHDNLWEAFLKNYFITVIQMKIMTSSFQIITDDVKNILQVVAQRK